jgi:hypothetical protein
MSLFKEPFNETIDRQLTARQKLIGKNEYTPQDITYLNSKTAWISLKSSVDSSETTDLAKNNVLLGGLGINNPNGSFSKSEYAYPIGNNVLGIKPMPGITNISIKNKGAYGSLRQVTVNFQCWDKKQLERLELLYMRPGFTVLLEWGWLPYIDNNGKLSNELYYDKSFFTRKDVDLQEYFKELKTLVLGSAGNYDFMFGYVMNYSWKLREDGGYDCSTEIISTGEVLESYKINFSTPEISAQSFNGIGTLLKNTITTVDNEEIETIRKDYSQNIIRGICSELYFIAKSDVNISSGVSLLDYEHENNKYSAKFISLDFITDSPDNATKKCSISGEKNIYIALRDFITLMNNFVLIKNPNNSKKSNIVSLSVNDRIESSKGNNEPLTCLYHPLQISADPTVCLIKNPKFLSTILEIPFTPEEITYKVQEATPDQKSIAATIRTKINDDKIDDKGLKNYLRDNIKNLATLLSIDKEYSTLYQESLYYGILKKLKTDGDINTLFPYEYPPLDLPPQPRTITGFDARTSAFNSSDLIKTPSASQFLSLDDKTRKEYIKNAQDRINKENEKEYNESVKAATSFFEKLDSIKGDNFPNSENKKGIIGNIYINLKYIYLLANNSSLEAQDQSEKNSIELMTFLRTMLRDVQSSIGNVNNFEIFNEDNVGYIIDLNASIDEKEFKPFKFEVGNRNSIIRSINLESQIFSNQSTIIAIAAQSDPGKLGLENSSMVAYNRGVTDRMISKKDINLGDSSIEKKKKGFDNLIINFKKFFEDLTKNPTFFNLFNNPSLDTQSIGTYKNALRDAIVFYTSQFQATNKYKDILPTKLSITMDGIGGIIIGNIFDVSKDVFPESYVGTQGIKLYYTVTGVNQDINNDGQWTTTIEGNPFIPDSSFDTSEKLTVSGNSIDYKDAPSPLVLVSSENVNEPPVNVIGNPKYICISMNSIFKGVNRGGDHNCGRYTYSLARNFSEARTKNQNMLTGPTEGSGGPAKDPIYHTNLKKYGYKEVARFNNVDKAFLANRLDKAQNQIGDVVVYWSNNPIEGDRNTAYLYGHTQIYTGGVRYDPIIKSYVVDPKKPKWACDDTDNYGTNFVYRSVVNADRSLPESWNFILFRL